MNNFNLLRLFFASLVILSHSPELIDGNRSREIATNIWGTMSFGEIAVDGFFLVSGFLIAQSFTATGNTWRYLAKRVLRIYPAFLAATVILLLVVAPLAGATSWTSQELYLAFSNAFTLEEPKRNGAFSGLHYDVLDASMWTISHEFRCYLAVIVLGLAGLLKRRVFLSAIAVIMLFSYSLNLVPGYVVPGVPIAGFLPLDIRMGGIFLVGILYFLWRDELVYSGRLAAIASVALFVLMFFEPTAEPALAILGGYLVFFVAFRLDRLKPLSASLKDDVSYGLYLYAWPIGNLLIYYELVRNPWAHAAATLVLASVCGFISWRLVERPFLRLKPGRPAASATAA